MTLSANRVVLAAQQNDYSITSSTVASKAGGTVSPSGRRAGWSCSRAHRYGPESLVAAPIARRLYAVGEVVGLTPSPGLPIAIVVDVHCAPEASMRFVACLAMCLILILANAAQTGAQAPSDPQGYCVNRSADFYPYTGEPCKSGYQLGSGNCRRTDGRMVAVPRQGCLAQAGTEELPFEQGMPPLPFEQIRPLQAPKSAK